MRGYYIASPAQADLTIHLMVWASYLPVSKFVCRQVGLSIPRQALCLTYKSLQQRYSHTSNLFLTGIHSSCLSEARGFPTHPCQREELTSSKPQVLSHHASPGCVEGLGNVRMSHAVECDVWGQCPNKQGLFDENTGNSP